MSLYVRCDHYIILAFFFLYGVNSPVDVSPLRIDNETMETVERLFVTDLDFPYLSITKTTNDLDLLRVQRYLSSMALESLTNVS